MSSAPLEYGAGLVVPTTTTTMPAHLGIPVGDYFNLPDISSQQFEDAGIPALVAYRGAWTYIGVVLEGGTSCDGVGASSTEVAGQNGEWALPLFYESVLLFGVPSTVAAFERCIEPFDIPTGWWADAWDEAVRAVG